MQKVSRIEHGDARCAAQLLVALEPVRVSIIASNLEAERMARPLAWAVAALVARYLARRAGREAA